MKKTLLSLIIMCFMAFTIVFSGCSPKGLQDNPPTDANVISNGGMTVVKGDYLYYVNGYIDETTLKLKDNEFGEVVKSGIYRTKLVNGKIVKDKDGFVKDENGNDLTECVVPKVVGFSNGGFYIMDDYIFYATPNMNLDRESNLLNDTVEFHRIGINGTKDKLVYTTTETQDNLDWSLYKIGDTIYLTTYVGSTIIIVNTETQKVVAEIKDCTSYAFLHETGYKTGDTRDSDAQKCIYFTRAITEDDNLGSDYKGNLICKVDITTGEIAKLDVASAKDYTYSIKNVQRNKVYYTKTNSKIGGLELLYAKKTENNWMNATEQKVTNVVYNSYYYCTYGDNLIIGSNSNGTFVIESGIAKHALAEETTILGVHAGYAYYAKDNKLMRFEIRADFSGGTVTAETVTDENKTHDITDSNYIDFDNQRVYVYCSYQPAGDSEESNYYLNYIDSELNERFVGKFEESHLPEVPEQDEESDEYIPHID